MKRHWTALLILAGAGLLLSGHEAAAAVLFVLAYGALYSALVVRDWWEGSYVGD